MKRISSRGPNADTSQLEYLSFSTILFYHVG